MSDDHSATVELCRELVRRPSVTPADHGCQELIAERLAQRGFTIEHMPAGEVKNLWARIGDSEPLVVLAGHTDVVPTGAESEWRVPPFSAEIIDGKLYGRGSSDMKGGVAAMITAAERLLDKHSTLQGSLAFLITSDEEGPAIDGTRHVVETLSARGTRIHQCIVGEPSSSDTLGDVIRHGRRGSLGCKLIARGIQGHVAYPHLARNPVHELAPFLTDLVAIEWDQGNDYFPPTTLQVSNLHAGTGATNVVPGNVTLDFNLRYCPDTAPSTIRERVAALVTEHNLDAELQWVDSAQPFITEPGPLTARFIATTDAEVIEFGTTNATIHQIDECVSLDELNTASLIYEQVLTDLLTKTATT